MSVQFDAAEAALLFSSDTFDIKRRATQKLFVLFEELRLQLKDTGEHLQFSFPDGVTDISGKISQGENYLGYPWVMLDFPRYFRGEDMFAFRTMFWFGHYFSAHFLLGGRMAERYLGHVWRNRGMFPAETHFSLHPDAWSHAVGAGASVQFHGLSEQEIRAHVAAHGFIKLSRKWEIADGDQVISEVRAFYAQVLGCLGEV